ncbi:MAG TPA: hypothetical protein VMF06_05745 [Candidatus Limnocylindria bacterium]|nr:hypothetical protein [Candidatus Limnocylindria bacterium]
MKKLILFLAAAGFLAGCDMSNPNSTPPSTNSTSVMTNSAPQP